MALAFHRIPWFILPSFALLLAACTAAPTRHGSGSSESSVVDQFDRSEERSPVLSGDLRPLPDESNPAIDRRKMLHTILNLVGTPYVKGGRGESGMDCSGFTSIVYRDALNQSIPASSQDQYVSGLPVSRNDLRFGDLVFFALEGEAPSHVGVYIGDGLFAHASSSRGVILSLLATPYYDRSFLGARRLVH